MKDNTSQECNECKKDWTKCSTCPVMMEWVREQKEKQNKSNVL